MTNKLPENPTMDCNYNTVYPCGHSQEEKPKSIWKDISELPALYENQEIFIRYKDGMVMEGQVCGVEPHFRDKIDGIAINSRHIDKYCTLTDFINEHNQLLADVADIKRKLNKY